MHKWALMDLFVDPVTGYLSETKISVLTIKLIFAGAFVYEIVTSKVPVSTELWLVVGSMFIAHEAWSRFSVARFVQPAIDRMTGAPDTQTTDTTSTVTTTGHTTQ